MKPSYKLDDFMKSCMTEPNKVKVLHGASITAQTDFNLNTQSQLIEFIGNGGLESTRFINCIPWKNNQNSKNPIMIDAYDFFSGQCYGYLAFFFAPTENWIIKSFKKNIKVDPRNFSFRDALTNYQAHTTGSSHDE